MRKIALAAAVLALAAVPAAAMRIAPPSTMQKVASADAVVVGKVTAIDEKTIKAPRFPGDKMLGEFRVATVKIEMPLLGVKGLTHVKVAWMPPPPPPPPGRPGGPIRIGGGRGPVVNLQKGQELLLFLKKLPKENVYTAASYFDVVEKKTPGFDAEVAEVKKYGKLLADPMAGLKAKSADDRFQTAALLLFRYRTFQQGGKLEPIPAQESKLILEAFADADWNAKPVTRPGPFQRQATPQTTFYLLGAQPKDGWVQPQNFQQFPDAAKKWLKDNAGTYRIQRYVTAKAEK
jgi:hypothetical protein